MPYRLIDGLEAGEVLWVDFGPPTGHEQAGRRPALVVSPRAYNDRSSLILVCPITRNLAAWTFKVEIEGTQIATMHRTKEAEGPCDTSDFSIGRERLTFHTERPVIISAFDTPGGGFNVLAAAARLGLRAAYAGVHGTGPLGDLARAGLAAEGTEVLQPPKPGRDTGFVVSMVDAAGERTFVTSPGAEATLTAADLAHVVAGPADAVYLSGYGLVHPANRDALLSWLARLGDGTMLFLDPGPLLRSIGNLHCIKYL